MKHGQRLELEQFWKVVKAVFNESKPCKISELESKTGVKGHHLNSFISYLRDVGVGVEVFDQDGENWMHIPKKPKISFELDLIEWLEVQSLLPWVSAIADQEKRVNMEQLFERLEKDQEGHDHFDAFQSLETKFHYLKSGHGIVLRILEEQILKGGSVSIKLIEGEHIDIRPLKTVEISSELMVIAEDQTHKCLSCYGIAEISSVEVLERKYLSTYTNQEIKQFVGQLTSIDQEAIRLVLKFKNQDSEQFIHPPFDTYGRPFVISHKDDSFIWAATLDQSQEVFDWLFQFGDQVMVLGPEPFLKNYIEYCETKLGKIA